MTLNQLESYIYARDLGLKYNRYIHQGIETANSFRNNLKWSVYEKPNKYYLDVKHVRLKRKNPESVNSQNSVKIYTDKTEYYIYNVQYNNYIYNFESKEKLDDFLESI